VNVRIKYVGYLVDFYCTYRIYVNNQGTFTRLETISEGNKIINSFSICDTFKDVLIELYETDPQTQRRVETELGKSIDYFTCKDYCTMGLSYYWGYDGYYLKY